MTTTPQINGTCDPRFTAVRETFADNFATFGETGAAVAVTIGGRPVVDLWAGFADAARTRPWERDTIVNVYSTTKGMTALCAHRLVDQGRLNLDAPVATYWPEFAQHGKDKLPVRDLLSHRAGLPAIEQPIGLEALYDWERMTSALAAQAPCWEPGSKHGYHALTFGYLVGEVVRRVSGRRLGEFFRNEVAAPLGIDFHIGLTPEHDARTAELMPPPLPTPEQLAMLLQIVQSSDLLLGKVFMNPLLSPDSANSRAWRAAEIPAANGHTNARALARVYGALACGGEIDGVTLLSRTSIERARSEQAAGPDAVLPLYTRFGLGFMLPTPAEPFGPNPRVFGHAGMGGSVGLADPEAHIGFGYTMNEMHTGLWLVDPRAHALINATYACL